MLIYVTFVIGSLKAFGILTNHCIIGFLYAKHDCTATASV